MRASARRALLLVMALGTACVTRTRRLAPSGTTAAVGTPEVVQEMARQALLLDAKGDRVLVDYRWINSEHNQAEVGRATFICEQKPKGWRIVHVHSSQPLPGDR